MGKGGKVVILEAEGPYFYNWNAGVLFRAAGWYNFVTKLNGENYGLSKTFALSFNGVQVQLGDLRLEVTKQSIIEALSLPQTKERWYKGQALGVEDLNFFLKTKHHNPL